MTSELPRIIQGGMGIGVSGWRLARAVSSRGELGVVSGSGLDTLFVRRLQDGDPGGHLRRAAAAFPLLEVSEQIVDAWYVEGGLPEGQAYRLLPMWRIDSPPRRGAVAVLAAFCEVFLAREGHSGQVGMNLLTKIEIPNPSTLYGAMLAGVDVVLMGAGIPTAVPGLLDELAHHRPVRMQATVEGDGGGCREFIEFDPGALVPNGSLPSEPILRPAFLPIVSSHSLARILLKKATGRIDGFVVEAPTAGGHNAPPRGRGGQPDAGAVEWGERDRVDLDTIRKLGLPFWLAGGMGRPGALVEACALGARGIQVGSLFALSRESGLDPDLKAGARDGLRSGTLRVRTSSTASPTGFPFKIVEMDGTLSNPEVLAGRTRRCDIGLLRTAYRRPDGGIGYRCPAEPETAWLAKGGDAEATRGRRCLCNALVADVGHPQRRRSGPEPGLVTAGDELDHVARFLRSEPDFTAGQALDWLRSASGNPA